MTPAEPDFWSREDSLQSSGPEPRVPAGILTVTQLTRKIASLVAGLGRVSVEGEVSRISRAASGHLYFDLKDLDSKLACVVWKSQVAGAVRFELREGMQVVAHGKLDVYAPRGTYSLTVQRLEQAGIGAMLVRFEELKRELRARGWFDRKRPIPSLPAIIGVATSRDGAAFQDFLRTRSLRWPGYPVRFSHTPVQGAGAAPSIASAIARLDRSKVDVIVVCRGGGSLEDLWAFNELPVAEAIWNASVPVVSGVGHETDVTLADLVADFRAHTPTDAAQTTIPDRAGLCAELERQGNYLAQAIEAHLSRRAESLERLAGARELRDPGWILGSRQDELHHLRGRLASAGARRFGEARAAVAELHRRLERSGPGARIEPCDRRLEVLASRLLAAGRATLERREREQAVLAARLGALSPLAILARGYSITRRRGAGEALKNASAVRTGDVLETRLHQGEVISTVVARDGGAPPPPREQGVVSEPAS